jgi:hypothetical protein
MGDFRLHLGLVLCSKLSKDCAVELSQRACIEVISRFLFSIHVEQQDNKTVD